MQPTDLLRQATNDEDPTKVYKLDLSSRNLSAVPSLKSFDKIRCLLLDFNYLSCIPPLGSLPDLRELHLEGNSISQIDNLEANRSLQVLNLRSNRIEKIQRIGHLIKLDTLLIDKNYISKLNSLEYLKDLRHISISNNRLESIENLPSFSKLEIFQANHNKIRLIPSNIFSNSTKITLLDLAQNCIEDTSFLQHLVNLEVLTLKNNSISEISLSAILPVLETLNIAQNNITALPYIAVTFPELITLDIRHNSICSQLELINAIADAVSLTEIDFRGNPMHTERFEASIQRVHNFDFLNGQAMNKPGNKYYEQVAEMDQNQQVFDYTEDEEDRKIRFSGFFDEQLEYKMTGLKPNRPSSPKKKTGKDSNMQEIQRSFLEFTANDHKIKMMRQFYLKIFDQSGLEKPHTEKEIPTEGSEQKFDCDKEPLGAKQLTQNEQEFKKESQRQIGKWKDAKQREKSFNIREAVKRTSKTREMSSSKAINASNGFSQAIKQEYRMRSDLMKTQVHPPRVSDPLRETEAVKMLLRPASLKRRVQKER